MLNKLGKLLKYEFLFYLRILLPLCLAVVLIAVLTRFQIIFSGVGTVLLYLIYSALLLAMMVICIILIIQRFIDNFLKEPGALMLTLPVTVWALTASKAIAAFCMILMCFLTVFVSGLVYAVGSESFFSANNFYMNGLRIPDVQNAGIDVTKFILPVCIIMFTTIQQICLIYLAITISHMLPRFRFIVGFVLYCVISSLANRIETGFVGGYVKVFSSDTYTAQLPAALITLFFAALFFWATGFFLKRTFNLE